MDIEAVTPTTVKVDGTMVPVPKVVVPILDEGDSVVTGLFFFSLLPQELQDMIWVQAVHPMAIVTIHGFQCQQFLATTTNLSAVCRNSRNIVKEQFERNFAHRYKSLQDLEVIPRGIAQTEFHPGRVDWFAGVPIVILPEKFSYAPEINYGHNKLVDHSCHFHKQVIYRGEQASVCVGDLLWVKPGNAETARLYYGAPLHTYRPEFWQPGTHVLENKTPELMVEGEHYDFTIVGPVVCQEPLRGRYAAKKVSYENDLPLIQLVSFSALPFRHLGIETYN